MKSSFPKCDKHHSKEWVSNVNAKFVDCLLEKSSSDQYLHRSIYEELFPKTRYLNFALETQFWNGAYRVLEKSSLYIVQ